VVRRNPSRSRTHQNILCLPDLTQVIHFPFLVLLYLTLRSTSQKQVLPLGSDFPIERVNPIYTFYAAVSRLSIDGTSPSSSPGGWYPAEKLSRQQALKGMTLDAAYASFAEDTIGSLKVGKKADFVVYDRDIMQIPESEILQAKVLATAVDGEVLFGAI